MGIVLKLFSLIHLVEAVLADGSIDQKDIGIVLDYFHDVLSGNRSIDVIKTSLDLTDRISS